MQLVRLPAWAYVVIGVLILALGFAMGRLAVDVAGGVVVAAGILKLLGFGS